MRALRLDPEPFIRHMPRVGISSAPLPGGGTLKLVSPGNEVVSNRLYWQGLDGYEPETTTVFAALARNASVVLDVGAHVGMFSLLAALGNPGARVFAFEPLPPILDLLRRNVALNQVANIEVVPCAAGERAGQAPFFFAETDIVPTASSLSQPFMQQWRLPLTEITVPVLTIDGFVEERGLETVDLVKLDTEATELEVLAGMRETISRWHPTLICEVLAGHVDVELLGRMVADAGYRMYHLTDEGAVPRDRIEPHWPVAGGYERAFRNYLFTTLDDAAVRQLVARASARGR